MDEIKKIAEAIKQSILDIEDCITIASDKKLTYNLSKNIRKHAQTLKVSAQALRNTTTAEFKKLKETK